MYATRVVGGFEAAAAAAASRVWHWNNSRRGERSDQLWQGGALACLWQLMCVNIHAHVAKMRIYRAYTHCATTLSAFAVCLCLWLGQREYDWATAAVDSRRSRSQFEIDNVIVLTRRECVSCESSVIAGAGWPRNAGLCPGCVLTVLSWLCSPDQLPASGLRSSPWIRWRSFDERRPWLNVDRNHMCVCACLRLSISFLAKIFRWRRFFRDYFFMCDTLYWWLRMSDFVVQSVFLVLNKIQTTVW